MVRLAKNPKAAATTEPAAKTGSEPKAKLPIPRGLTERQWVIGLLVATGLLLLITFRGCVLPSGVGPKAKPVATPSAAPSAPATAAPIAGDEYTVQAGDSLSKIAQKTGASVEAIQQANGLNRSSILSVGQKLKIPK